MEPNRDEIIVSGKILKRAHLKEEWYQDLDKPDAFIAGLSGMRGRPDIFSFWQRLPDTAPRYPYHMETDEVAAIPIVDYEHWLKRQVSSATRRAVKNAKKKGVVVKLVEFDDGFVSGMADIFNESPLRQGKPFWHYGKDVTTLREEFSRNLHREDIIGAYYHDELIGFIMLANAGKYAMTTQIISKVKHRDKYVNNVLIAKAVEVCVDKNYDYLVYLRWGRGSLGEFKRRNGFEKIGLPRYYVPLTTKGKMALQLKLHHGIKGVLPERVVASLLKVRMRWYSMRHAW